MPNEQIRMELRGYTRRVRDDIGLEAARVLRSGRSLVQVRTGRMRSSWRYAPQGERSSVLRFVNPVRYARFMERGTRNYTPPVRRPALTTIVHNIHAIIARVRARTSNG